MKKKLRKSNIELLRITLIMMIISHHIIVHGLGLRYMSSPNFEVENSTYLKIILNSLFVVGVNGFVFISGYFGINFNVKRIISILVQAFFYSVTFYLIAFVTNQIEFSKASFWESFFPISNNVWWFITTYIGLYFIAPFLNAGMKNIAKTELFYVLVGLLILNCFSSFYWGGISKNGYDLFNFICIYLVGRYMKVNDLKILKPKLILLLSSTVVSVLATSFLYFNYHEYAWQQFHYNNPFLILSAISLFFIFHDLDLKYNKYINLFAQTVLGVYMIHDYPRNRRLLIELVHSLRDNFDTSLFILLLILLVVLIFLICGIIDLFRLCIFSFVSNKISNLSIIRELTRRIKAFADGRFIK